MRFVILMTDTRRVKRCIIIKHDNNFRSMFWGMTKYRKGPQRTHKGPQRTTKEHYTRPQRIGNHEKTARLAKISCIFSFELLYFYFCIFCVVFTNFRVLMRLNDLWRFTTVTVLMSATKRDNASHTNSSNNNT